MSEEENEILVQKMIRDYTTIKPVVMEGFPDASHVWLTVGVQSFIVTPEGVETMDDAKMMQRMLGIALSHIVENENGTPE